MSSNIARLISVFALCSSCTLAEPITLEGGEHYSNEMKEGSEHLPIIYCHKGGTFSYFRVFATTRIEFTILPTSYSLFEGANVSEVESMFLEHTPNWIPLIPWKRSSIYFPPFETKCVGIQSDSSYRFHFKVLNIDFFKVIQCLAGVALFFSAKTLVRSRLVFYSGGTSVGVVASLLIIVFVVSRFIPRKSGMWVSIIMGWSFSVYIFHMLWTNLYDVLLQYRSFVLAYFGISAIISFAICYRYGPPSSERTHDLMQWLVQGVALAVVYYSSDVQEVTLAMCIVCLCIYNFPEVISSRMSTYIKRRFFPPKIRLMTEDEFMQQGDDETRRHLDKLREFASSPDCDAWKVMSRLKNPQRFGSFVLGESHLEDAEILEYETGGRAEDDGEMLTDDDSSENEITTMTATANGCR